MDLRIYLLLFAALTSLRFPGICLGTELLPLMCNVTIPKDTNQTYCLCAKDKSCDTDCLKDADILVSRSFRMTCNGGSPDGIYSLILKHIQPTTSSGSRGLLSRIAGSTETISSLKVDDADDFDGLWYFVFADQQHMQVTLSDILNGSKTINVISQDVQLMQDSDVIELPDLSDEAQCFHNNDNIYICNRTVTSFTVILVSACNNVAVCRRMRCSRIRRNITISKSGNPTRPRLRCMQPSSEQPSNQIWITVVEGVQIHNITLHLLSFTDLSPAVTASAYTTTQPLTSTVETTTTTTRRTTEVIKTEGTTLPASTAQQEPGTTEGSSVAQTSTESINPVIPVVIVIVVVFMIVVISGAICYKRRQLSRVKDRDPHLDAPATVLNPSFTIAVDQNDYVECANPIEGASNAAMPLFSEDNQHNEYSELPTSIPSTRQGNLAIYNEVGEQDYNVLFGGKEQGDYHEYNLPETAQKTPSGPYQDLMKDRPTGTLLKGVERALNSDNDKIFQPQNKGAPTKRDSHAYQDLREHDNNYTSVLRGTSTSPVVKNPAINHISKTQTLQDQDEEYSGLPSLVSPTSHDNEDIYNEVGEQDYNVLFGGKEQGDYHKYNLPECAQKTPSGPYQDLLKAGMQGRITEGSSLKGTLGNETECALVEAKRKDLHVQKKRGVPKETVDQGYQDLRKDDSNSTSNHLNAKTPTKPESSSSVASMNNTYQALQTSGPHYAILKPNTNDPSPAYPKPGSLPNNDYQSFAGSDDAARGFDQGGVSVKQDASQDNTYQHLIKDDNTPESMNGNTKAMGKDKDNTYDVLQHGLKTAGRPPSNGYGSLGMTTETGGVDNDYPGAEPKATSDYEVPEREISEEPYDHLQRKELSETSPINPGTMAEKSADDDDYENPSSYLDNETNAYQTLDNLISQGNDQEGVDEDYTHLQRPLGNKVSPGRTGASDMGNQYGKLNFAYESK